MIISLNIDTGVQKYYFLREGEERKILLSFTMSFRFIITSLVAFLVIIFSRQISKIFFQKMDYSTAISLLATALPLADINSRLILLLRLKRKDVIFSVYNVSHVIVQPVFTYVCVVSLQQNLEGVFIAQPCYHNNYIHTFIYTATKRLCKNNEITGSNPHHEFFPAWPSGYCPGKCHESHPQVFSGVFFQFNGCGALHHSVQ